MRKYDWSHPLLFGNSLWVQKSDVEWLVKSAQQLIRSMYKNGYPSANEWAAMESALIELVGNEPANNACSGRD